MPITPTPLGWSKAWGVGYLQRVVGALKTTLITAYLAAKVDAGVGYLLSVWRRVLSAQSTASATACQGRRDRYSEKKAAFCCGFDLLVTNFQRPDGPKAPHSGMRSNTP